MSTLSTHLTRTSSRLISFDFNHQNIISAITKYLLIASTVLMLSSCAMTPNGRGGTVFGLDHAELFGSNLGSFQLRDGSEGTLRKDVHGVYSIKVAGYRVAPLKDAIAARIARVENVGKRTVVIVETQERNCAYRYQVLAIDGSDVLQWKLGNCVDRPQVQLTTGGQALMIDFPNYNRVARNVYSEDRLLSSLIFPPPGVDLAKKPFANESLHADSSFNNGGRAADGSIIPGARVIPAPPRTSNGKTSNTSSNGNARKDSAASNNDARKPATLNFGTEEIKPIRIDLRK